MSSAAQQHQEQTPDGDLSLREAAAIYDVTVRTLAQRLRLGELAGYKTRGSAGREWRVCRDGLDDAGYRRRLHDTDVARADELLQLRQDLAGAKRIAAAERRRADDLDRRLGHVLLEAGRLRTALAAATGEAPPTETALDAHTASWLIAAVTGGPGPQRGPATAVRDVATQSRA